MAALGVDEAFAVCEARVRAHYENFPVGLFVPREKRRYVHALYAYARAADDFADEPMYEGMRAEKLDQWEARLHAAYEGRLLKDDRLKRRGDSRQRQEFLPHHFPGRVLPQRLDCAGAKGNLGIVFEPACPWARALVGLIDLELLRFP